VDHNFQKAVMIWDDPFLTFHQTFIYRRDEQFSCNGISGIENDSIEEEEEGMIVVGRCEKTKKKGGGGGLEVVRFLLR